MAVGEGRRMEMALTAMVVATLWSGALAQSSSCSNALVGMSPCLDYITGNSSTPSASCCGQLRTVVRSQPQCLCEALTGGGGRGGALGGLNINPTQAQALPRACNVQTPPVSRCNAASPAGSPAGSPTTPSGTGPEASEGNSTKLPFSMLFIALMIISSFSTI